MADGEPYEPADADGSNADLLVKCQFREVENPAYPPINLTEEDFESIRGRLVEIDRRFAEPINTLVLGNPDQIRQLLSNWKESGLTEDDKYRIVNELPEVFLRIGLNDVDARGPSAVFPTIFIGAISNTITRNDTVRLIQLLNLYNTYVYEGHLNDNESLRQAVANTIVQRIGGDTALPEVDLGDIPTQMQTQIELDREDRGSLARRLANLINRGGQEGEA